MDPIPFGHGGFVGAVPRKCSECSNLFEGSCLREMKSRGRYKELDYGACGIAGDTSPVALERSDASRALEVPRKCSTCQYLRGHEVHEVVCTKDVALWGQFSRTLDWGVRAPGVLIPPVADLQITLRFVRLVAECDDTAALREFRTANPNESLASGKVLCERVRASLQQAEGAP
jgi:hypothetical protein